jgi:NAD+ kinase
VSRGAIGFLLHPDEVDGVIAGALRTAARHGYRTWTTVVHPAEDVASHAEGTELLVTVGGDGTFLFGARLAAPRGIPVLGVNRGRLGFLTNVQLTDLPAAIDAFAAGATVRQRRSLLTALIDGGAGTVEALALNDIVLKSREVAVVRLRVDADGERLGDFDADGVVVASATGSTGYALSAGGPPIDPRVPAIVVVPLAPHAVLTRPVVLPEMTVIDVTVDHGRVFVAADGQEQARLEVGGRVRISAGPELSVVRLAGSPSFLRQLREKVHFGLPLKLAEDRRLTGDGTPAAAGEAPDGPPRP